MPSQLKNQLILLAGEANDKRMTFYAQDIESDYVVLNITARNHASMKIFWTTLQAQLEDFYPVLPKDPQVKYEILPSDGGFDENAIQLSWNISDTIKNSIEENSNSKTSKYRFCAVVSRRPQEYNMCDELNENIESIHCVNQNFDRMKIEHLRNGRNYHINLFVRDTHTGGIASYNSLEIFLHKNSNSSKEISSIFRGKKSKSSKRNNQRLYDSKLEHGKLGPTKGAIQNYNFQIYQENSKRVLLILHSCDGYIRVAIYRNGKLLKKSEPFTGFRRFLIMNAHYGNLAVQVINDDYKPKSFRLWASIKPEKSPYPMLPEDTSVKEANRTCNSVTLQWLKSSNTNVRYCIYSKKENINYLEELVSQKTPNFCKESFAEEQLVGCYNQMDVPSFSSLLPGKHDLTVQENVNEILETTIGNLDADSLYRFDMLARPMDKSNNMELPYRTVWVRTKAC
uniref:Protein NDNF C-terminal domain-containing protein n=1 Tax=Acrobeloides nanus TaxID=290746 RepID=A0A914E9K8_9BILA